MKILLLGNGFDLEHNLPTSYNDFILFCRKVMPIFSSDADFTTEKYKREYLDSWEIDKSVKQTLIDAFDSRYIDKESAVDLMYDTGIRTANEMLNELYSYIKFNTWLRYFQECSYKFGRNWIDFESEISKVIKTLDRIKKQLSSNKNILEGKFEGDVILIEICKAAATTFQTVFRNSEAIEDFAALLNKELDILTRALEIYISCFINKMDVSRLSPDIEPLNPDCILSFNYSNTFERIYGIGKNLQYAYIHGKADISKNVESCNMVLGIDEYLEDDSKNTELEFLTFKKYYQRIYKSTDSLYLDWIDEIKDGYNDYLREIEAAYVRNNIPEKLRPRTISHNNRIYTEAPPMHFPEHTLYIFGHSLDVTDKDILKMFICNNNVQTKIFYHRNNAEDKKSLGKIIRNLIIVMGQDELICRTGGVHKTIEFIPQALHEE